MVMQDLTKFLITGVLLGFVLAMAVFRPGILSAEHRGEATLVSPAPPTPGKKDSPGQALAREELCDSCSGMEQDECEQEHGERARALDELERELNAQDEKQSARKVQLDEWEKDLKEQERRLDAWEENLNKRRSQLEERERRVEEKENQLRKERKELDEGWAALRKAQARLAEEKEALKGLRRWTETALLLTGLLSVPSFLVLALLVRKELRT